MQDTKKNIFTKKLELRYYAHFPLFNYGFLPRTWEQNLVKEKLGYFVQNV
jgi:inorganic pyrophosphatase